MNKTIAWLDRQTAPYGPFLTLCLCEKELQIVAKHLNLQGHLFWVKPTVDAHVTFAEKDNKLLAIVCFDGKTQKDGIQIACLLVHEAVHIWQQYSKWLGETNPGEEQEAYAIQYFSQTLLNEYARRLKLKYEQ